MLNRKNKDTFDEIITRLDTRKKIRDLEDMLIENSQMKMHREKHAYKTQYNFHEVWDNYNK